MPSELPSRILYIDWLVTPLETKSNDHHYTKTMDPRIASYLEQNQYASPNPSITHHIVVQVIHADVHTTTRAVGHDGNARIHREENITYWWHLAAPHRKWTESAEYHSPIDFKEMQRKGRERDDGTIIIRTVPFFYSILLLIVSHRIASQTLTNVSCLETWQSHVQIHASHPKSF